MTHFTNPLDNIKIASPCSADWNSMVGNNRQRYCGDCKLNVYNLSGMSRLEAEDLLIKSEGRVCVRYFRRSDGTILTKDCPVGWQAFKKRMSRFWTATASLLLAILGGIGLTTYLTRTNENEVSMGTIAVEQSNNEMGAIEVDKNTNREFVMGNIAIPDEFSKGRVSNFDEVKRKVLSK